MQNNQAFFEILFKRKFSDGGNKELLEQVTSAHPYFSPAQFYLLQQTKEDSEAYNAQAARTGLAFNNPHWLNFQLQQTKEVPVVEPAYSTTPSIPKLEEAIIEKEQVPFSAEVLQPADPVVELEQPVPADMPKLEEPIIEKEPVAFKTEVAEEEKIPTELEQTTSDDTAKQEEIIMEKEIEAMKIELKIPAEKNAMDEMPHFEPMHMVDYFASQGIKLSEEVQTADKLGKQLKSFTEWLKTMKKVHVENQGQPAGQTDTAIQSLAEKSNTEDEVLTVAMADVFAKQGKLEKARELLEKLSLLNPAKSAYFAAKIESLKEL